MGMEQGAWVWTKGQGARGMGMEQEARSKEQSVDQGVAWHGMV